MLIGIVLMPATSVPKPKAPRGGTGQYSVERLCKSLRGILLYTRHLGLLLPVAARTIRYTV